MKHSYDFIRNQDAFYQPRTPRAGYQAYVRGLIPIEGFINRALKVKPISMEPFDFDEIDRLLATKNMDLQAVLILKGIFDKMLQNSDQEQALFAAESINTIETRMQSRITELRILDPYGLPLVQAYVELAQFHGSQIELARFYLSQAWGVVQNLLTSIREPSDKTFTLDRSGEILKTAALVQLGLGEYEHALELCTEGFSTLDANLVSAPTAAEATKLSACYLELGIISLECHFFMRNVVALRSLLQELQKKVQPEHQAQIKKLAAFWFNQTLASEPDAELLYEVEEA